jgi:hypothetical protein
MTLRACASRKRFASGVLAAFDPGFGLGLRGQGPAQEALNLVVAVDREAVVLAIDLAGEDARPVAEPQLGEGGLGHQVAHRQTERDIRARRLEHLQVRVRGDRSGSHCSVGWGHRQRPP